MDIHLIQYQTDRGPIRLFVAGNLEAEIVCGTVLTGASLRQEVEGARCLKALATFIRQWQRDLEKVKDVPDHVEKTPQARQAAFCRGLEAGLCGATIPYPGLAPRDQAMQQTMLPESSQPYTRGYEHGESLRRCIDIIERASNDAA